MKSISKPIYLILLIVVIVSCSTDKIQIKDAGALSSDTVGIKTTGADFEKEVKSGFKEPKISITSPRDGEIINKITVIIFLNVSNFKLVSQNRYPKNGEGHIGILFDDIEVMDDSSIFTFENQGNGTHIIHAMLMMGNHTILPYNDTIKIYINNTDKFGGAAAKKEDMPDLIIVHPKEGELIKNSSVMIQLLALNFNIVPVETPAKDGEGHFHVWLDGEKKVTTEIQTIFENAVSGKHSIAAELVKSDHSSLTSKTIKSIMVNVESDYVPKETASQYGIREYTVEADDKDFYPNRLKAKANETVRINFKFLDGSIYFAGLDVTGPFETIKYKLNGAQPVTREFNIRGETKITSYWPSSGVKKADLVVEIEK